MQRRFFCHSNWFNSYTERTLVLLKPDVFQRGKVGNIISRFEDKGLKIVGCKLTFPTKEICEQHYGSEHAHKPFYPRACRFLNSGPVLAMVLEGRQSIKSVRKMVGTTDPAESPVGTIRGDFGQHWRRNLIHASDSVDNANQEITFWFQPEEIKSWGRMVDNYIFEDEYAPIDFESSDPDFHAGHLNPTDEKIDPLPLK